MSAEELEAIVERCLVDSGIWSARRSDGVTALRLVIAEAAHTRAWFQVYDIDQSLHVGCLDMQREDNAWRWTLHLQPEGEEGAADRRTLIQPSSATAEKRHRGNF